MRQLILQGLAAVALPAAGAAGNGGEQAAPARPPDAHIIRPPRGDVIEESEGAILPDYGASTVRNAAQAVPRARPAPARRRNGKRAKPRPAGR